ncbi:MAG TPA: M42 family metallopeptidase [Firmicutes bacterium]|nr:M42 family metallopeptidase [Bacillota bacterium]
MAEDGKRDDPYIKLLAELSEAFGPSGGESPVASIAGVWLKPWCDEIWEDEMGNLLAKRHGYGDGGQHVGTVVIASHMDEVGLIVKDIDERGFLRFAVLGGIDERVLVGQEVTVLGRQPVGGVIGMKPPHLLRPDEAGKSIPMADLFIDTGLGTEVKRFVSVGDMACFKSSFRRLKGELVTGKALDNRAGVATACQTMRLLSARKHPPDVIALLSTQEEEGLRGAMTGCYRLKPKVAIALDVTHGDMPGLSEWESHKLGGGPTILVGANAHPKLAELLFQVAGELGMECQTEVAPGRSGTDAWEMQVSREGVATAVVSIPLRYMHSPVETMDVRDGKRCAELLATAISRMEKAFMEGLNCWD